MAISVTTTQAPDGSVIREEVYRDTNGDPRYRRFDPADATTPEEDRPATEVETRSLRERERGASVKTARRDRSQAISQALASAPTRAIITLLVAEGVLDPETAEAAGWTPPT